MRALTVLAFCLTSTWTWNSTWAAEPTRKGPARFDRERYKLGDLEKAALAERHRDEEIASLKAIILKVDPSNPQKADMLFQLSELYWQKSKYLAAREMLAFQEQERRYDEAKDRGEKVAPPKLDNRASEHYRAETMRLYEAILREFAEYERKDEVLFSLAYNQYEVGRREAAVAHYEELVKTYPGSKFLADAYVQLGNHFFDVANDLARARAAFERAFAKGAPKVRSYALYKLAWCDLNAGAYAESLKKLKEVVLFTQKHEDTTEFTDLKNEALNDMVQVFVQLDQAKEASAYFAQVAGKKRQTQLRGRLAAALLEAGRFESAIATYRALLEEHPMGEEAPSHQQAIVRGFEGLRQRAQVKAEVKRLAEAFSPGSAWWAANASKPQVLREAFSVTEEAMRTLVTDYHQEAQRTKQVETYRLARDIYRQYVDAFASGDDERFISDFAFNLRFYYAEILWALSEWEAAAREYERVVSFKIPARDTAKEVSQEKYRQTAGYNAILAYERLLRMERGQPGADGSREGQLVDERRRKGTVERTRKLAKRSAKDLAQRPLTETESRLVKACDAYIKRFPNGQDEIDVRYQAAVIYYDKNHFVEAANRLGEIILKWPEEKRSQDAADLSMSVLEEREEWKALNRLARQFAANKRLAKPGSEFGRRVAQVVEGSQYKWVDEVLYKKERRPAEAAAEFLKFADEFPRSLNAERALTYAAVILAEAPAADQAIEVGQRLLKGYPSTRFELKVKSLLAGLHAQRASFREAATGYEALVAAYDAWTEAPATKRASPRSKQKSPLRDSRDAQDGRDAKDGDGEEEGDGRQALLKEAEAWIPDAIFNAGFYHEAGGELDRAIAMYERYIKQYKTRPDVPQVMYGIGLALGRAGRHAEAARAFARYVEEAPREHRVAPASLYEARHRQLKSALAAALSAGAEESDRLVKELVGAFPKLPAAARQEPAVLNVYAHARFLALEPSFRQYRDIKFKRVATLKKDLNLKVKRLAELEKRYTEVLALGSGEWGVAALTRVGQAYADFAQNFVDSPDPKGLDEEELSLYRSELQSRVVPLEEKAAEALEKALSKSYELMLYTEWTLAAQDQLNRYRPGTFGKVLELPYQGAEVFQTAGLEQAPAKQALSAGVRR